MKTIEILKKIKNSPLKKGQVVEDVDDWAANSLIARGDAKLFVAKDKPVK